EMGERYKRSLMDIRICCDPENSCTRRTEHASTKERSDTSHAKPTRARAAVPAGKGTARTARRSCAEVFAPARYCLRSSEHRRKDGADRGEANPRCSVERAGSQCAKQMDVPARSVQWRECFRESLAGLPAGRV